MIGSGVLRAEGATVVRGRPLLQDVDLEARPGELLALLGPNGAGKSTLVSVLSGERRPDAGRVLLDDEDVARVPPSRLARRRALLAQSSHLGFAFTAREVIELGRAPWVGTAREPDDARAISAAVERADATHLLDREVTSLSGGEAARVALARVLAQDTDVVLLDEPTAALDLRHQEHVMAAARDLAAAGRTVVVVVHDLSLAAAYAHRVALLVDGRLAAIGTPPEVLTAERIGSAYGLAVEIAEHAGCPLVLPMRERALRGQPAGA